MKHPINPRRSSQAQLKVNLRPLWSPAAEALGTLSERFGDTVWSLVFQEVKTALENSDASTVPTWMSEDEDGDGDSIREEEKTWRDPSAHKLRVAVSSWLRDDQAQKSIIKVCQSLHYSVSAEINPLLYRHK